MSGGARAADAKDSSRRAQPSATSASGSSGASASGAQAPSDKLDVSDLENKYWAAKDTDFSVVQNRLFSKAKKFAFTPEYGMYLTEPWSSGATLGLSTSYFFNERYGLEFAYTKTDSKDSEGTAHFRAQGAAPDHNKMKQFYGAAFNWVPFYAKMSVLNSQIIYFDMSLSPGLGLLQYEQQTIAGPALKTAPALTLDLTQHFFLSKWLALRFELKNRWSSQDVLRYTSPNFQKLRSETNQTSLLIVGATFYY
jgi:outer membrane beta-barrel protein